LRLAAEQQLISAGYKNLLAFFTAAIIHVAETAPKLAKKIFCPKKTYNTRDSLVVTDPTTNLALASLTMGERTGSRIIQQLWSYVLLKLVEGDYKPSVEPTEIQHRSVEARSAKWIQQ
jgi:hypothetical protein